MDKLYMVIPAYNEEENILEVLDDWYPMVVMTGPESRLVIIDDGSRDSTYELLKKERERRPQLIVRHKKNSGHGSTLLSGYHFAVSQGADYVFQTDSDGQTKPDEFPAFWHTRRHYDMVIGSRRKREDGVFRVLVTKVLKLVVLVCFHVSVEDANTPFRLMNAKALSEELSLVPRDFFLANVLLTVIFTKHKRRVKFVPITFRPRQGGINSINFKRIFKIGKQSVRDFIILNKTL